MKMALFETSRSKTSESQLANDLDQLLMEVRQGDIGATVQLLIRYHKQVVSVAFDVLRDETLAKESAWETLKNAINQLQRGVRTGAFEPWLMWLTRSNALRYLQMEHLPEPEVKSPKVPPVISKKSALALADTSTPALNKPVSIYDPPPFIRPRSAKGVASTLWNDPAVNRTPQSCDSKEPYIHTVRNTAMKNQCNNETPLRTANEEKTDVIKDDKKRVRRRKDTVLTVAMAMLCIALLWIVFGLIAKNISGSLPDLGYSWFNNNLLPLF